MKNETEDPLFLTKFLMDLDKSRKTPITHQYKTNHFASVRCKTSTTTCEHDNSIHSSTKIENINKELSYDP